MMAKPVSHRAPEFIQGNLEYQVIALGIPRGGFVDDRPRLPGEVEDQVVKLFKPKLSAEMEAKCRARLRLIFATIAEADVAREVYRSRSKSRDEASIQSLNAKRQAKAITLAGRRLASQAKRYRQLREWPSRTREETLLFMEGLSQDVGVAGALKSVLPMNWRWHPGWYRNEQSLESVFQSFGAAFSLVQHELAAISKTGRNEAALSQLCRALALLYRNATGKCPTRHFNAYEEKESDAEHGPFLKICRLMARALDDLRVDRGQKSTGSRVTKLARNAVREIKQECSRNCPRCNRSIIRDEANAIDGVLARTKEGQAHETQQTQARDSLPAHN